MTNQRPRPAVADAKDLEHRCIASARPGTMLQFWAHEPDGDKDNPQIVSYLWGMLDSRTPAIPSKIVVSAFHPQFATMKMPYFIYSTRDICGYVTLEEPGRRVCLIPKQYRYLERQYPKVEAYLRYMMARDLDSHLL